MSLFIKGVEMPESGEILDILIFPNGEVQKRCSVNGFQLVQEASAVSGPTPHGRLGDLDELKKQAYPFPCAIGVEHAVTIRAINEMPTIIEAER